VSDGQWKNVCFTDLAPLTDGAFIAGQIASTIQPPLAGRVESVNDLVARLADCHLLLILDNCEHLIADAAARRTQSSLVVRVSRSLPPVVSGYRYVANRSIAYHRSRYPTVRHARSRKPRNLRRSTCFSNAAVNVIRRSSSQTTASALCTTSAAASMATARRHAGWLADIGDRMPLQRISLETFSELAPELDNARAALAWALDSSFDEDHTLGGRIITGLPDLWMLSGRLSELRNLRVAALKLIDEAKSPDLAAKMLQNYIVSAFNEPDVVRAIERAIPVFDQIGDTRAIAKLHSSLTFIFAYRGLIAEAQESAARVEALYPTEESRRSREYVESLYHRAMLHEAQKRFEDARADIHCGEAIASAINYKIFIIRNLKRRRLFIEASIGNTRRAIEIANEMLASEFGANPDVSLYANQCLAMLHLELGEADHAAAAASVVLNLSRGDESLVLQYVAGIAALRGGSRRAARLAGFIDSLERVPSQRDSLQQQGWDRLCSYISRQLEPEAIALYRAEGAILSVQAADIEGRVVLGVQ
jgi:tetratricopeptide (TPR) repeat protein